MDGELNPVTSLLQNIYLKYLENLMTEGKPMDVTAEMAAEVISVIETAHAANPMSVKF